MRKMKRERDQKQSTAKYEAAKKSVEETKKEYDEAWRHFQETRRVLAVKQTCLDDAAQELLEQLEHDSCDEEGRPHKRPRV